jgi:hypothetical protein
MPPLPRPVTDPERLQELIDKVVPGGAATTVAVAAPTWAAPTECVVNVARAVEEGGGEAVNGWNLIETLPGVLMEAEFHSLWRAPDGSLHDVTPKELPMLDQHTVFLADPSLKYEGRQIDNVRVPLVDDQLIRSHISIQKKKFAALNEGQLAGYHGTVAIDAKLKKILEREERFVTKIFQRYY